MTVPKSQGVPTGRDSGTSDQEDEDNSQDENVDPPAPNQNDDRQEKDDQEDDDKPNPDDPDDNDPEEYEADDLRERLRQRIRAVVPENATNETVVPESDPADLTAVMLRAESLLISIATANLETLKQYEAADVRDIENDVRDVAQKVAQRKTEAHRIAEAESKIAPHEAADTDELRSLAEARKKVTDLLAVHPLTDKNLSDADVALKAAQTLETKILQDAQSRIEEGKRIASEVEKLKDHPEAEDVENQTLAQARKNVTDKLAEIPLTQTVLEDANQLLALAAKEAERIGQAVDDRKEEKKRILLEVEKIKDDPDADDTEKGALATACKKVRDTLDQAPLTEKILEGARTLLAEAEQQAEGLVKAAQLRRDKHKEIKEDGDEVKTVGVLSDQIEKLENARQALNTALSEPLSNKNNETAEIRLNELKKVAETIDEELKILGGKDGVDALCDEAGVDRDKYADLERGLGGRKEMLENRAVFSAKELGALCKAFGGADKIGPLIKELDGPGELKKLQDALGGAENLVTLTTGTKLDGAGIKKLCYDLGTKLVADMLKAGVKADDIGKLHAAIGDAAPNFTQLAAEAGLDGKPKALMSLFLTGCDADAVKFQAFCNGFGGDDEADKRKRASLKGLVDKGGLGDAPEAFGALLATGCDGDTAKLVEFGAEFDTDDKRDALKRMLTDGGLAGKAPPLVDKDVDPKCLALMLKNAKGDTGAAKAKGLADLFAEMDISACTNFKTTLTDGGLGQAPEALGHVLNTGCDGDAARLKEFSKAFKDETSSAALKLALTEGGLTGKSPPPPLAAGDIDAQCLGQILKNGAGPAPGTHAQQMGKVATLLKGLGKSDCGNFKKVLSEGGLGQAPEAMGHLIGIGCDGEPGKLTKTLDAFDSEDKRKGLGRLLNKGGFDGKAQDANGKPKVDPTCLAQMLKHGAGDRPDTAVGDENTRRAEKLAALGEGMDETQCTNLGTCLDTGKLGTEPEVFGKLVGTGCKGDPAKLNALTKELKTDPNAANLANLLQKGGMGTKDHTGTKIAATDVADTSCLANLFEPGCDGDPAELTKLLTALNDTGTSPTALGDLKGVMTEGNLGKHPKVIGKLYKQGCLDDPNGAHDGKKNPNVLIDMVGEFADPDGPELFKNMLKDSGFAEGGKEDRLASVVQHAFTPPRGPNKGKQQSKSLRKLAKSFDGKFADLKTTIKAFEDAPDHVLEKSKPNEPNQPGKGLKNVIHAERFKGDPTKLKAEFFDKLNTRATAAPTATETVDPWHSKSPPRMDMTELLQTAASFEHEPIGAAQVAVDCGATGTINMDMDHAAGRHTRKHCKFYMNGSPQMGTTLYPRTVNTAELKKKTEETVKNGVAIDNGQPAANRPSTAPPPAGPRRTPPEDDFDFYGNFCSTQGNDNEGISNRIGFSKVGAPPYSVGQVFPKPPHAKLVSVNNNDMITIDNILNNKNGALY
ncbi:hypothetical protein [Ruegeria jejuensis]|uniref:hypothetical protein n=1 Tax=Ruegeria jejuensis TaxID=3233338 RepID=UPI00355B2D8E